MLQRVLSQKNIQNRQLVSPPSSLRDVGSPRSRLESHPNHLFNDYGNSSLKDLQKSTEETPNEGRPSVSNKIDKNKEEFLKTELSSIRKVQE